MSQLLALATLGEDLTADMGYVAICDFKVLSTPALANPPARASSTWQNRHRRGKAGGKVLLAFQERAHGGGEWCVVDPPVVEPSLFVAPGWENVPDDCDLEPYYFDPVTSQWRPEKERETALAAVAETTAAVEESSTEWFQRVMREGL